MVETPRFHVVPGFLTARDPCIQNDEEPKKLGLPAWLCVVLLAVSVTPAVAQNAGTIARAYLLNVKLGMGAQFEEAFKSHVAWRQAEGDPWTWQTFLVVDGENLGQYIVRSGNHQWSDLDSYADFLQRGSRHFVATVTPFLDGISSNISLSHADISRLPDDLASMTMFQVVVFHLHSQGRFIQSVTKIHDAIGTTGWPVHYAFSEAVSGDTDGPSMTLVLPAGNWAGFQEPDTNVVEMLTEAYGQEEALEILSALDDAVRYQESFTVQLRPDLSLMQ